MIFRIVTFGVAAALGTVLAMWTVDRDPPIIVNSVEVETPVVQAGGLVRLHYIVRRFRDCSYISDRVILDSAKVRFVLPDISFIRPPGTLGMDDYRMILQLPTVIAQGPAIYRVTLRYECNVLHRWWPIVSRSADVGFTVEGVAEPVIPVKPIP